MILAFFKSNVRRETGGFEVASTITLALQANRLIKCASHCTKMKFSINPLTANPTKWLNTLKQFVGNSNCLSVFDHFVKLALEGLFRKIMELFRKYDQIRSFLQIWSHLLKKSLMEVFVISCAMSCKEPEDCIFFYILSFFLNFFSAT